MRPPYNAWFVGNVIEVNKKRTETENVCIEMYEQTYGETRGMFVADAESYGAHKLWCLLKPIPVDLDDEEVGPSAPSSTPMES